MERKAPSYVGRAVLAAGLTVAFYALSLVIVAALIGVPVWVVVNGHRFPIFIGLAMVVTGLGILHAIIPRRQRFHAPGPQVTATDEPELMAVVEEVAATVGHPVPHATFLTPEVN